MKAKWWRIGAAVLLVALAAPAAINAARRNRAYLHLLHAGAGAGPGSSDALLILRRSLRDGDWPTAQRMLAQTAGPDRLAALLVLRDAERRVTARDADGARAALAIVGRQAGDDYVVWYRAGAAYERLGASAEAVQAYARGSAADPAAPWSEGRYRTAMLHQHDKQWQPLADVLEPILGSASDEDIARDVQPLVSGGAIWQGAFLALGDAYDHLGKAAEAERTYERVARIAKPRRDWTLNRALVYLARAKRAHGDLAAALESVGRALDLATTFDDSFRREYELDTAAEAGRLIGQAQRDGQLNTLQTSLEALVQRAPDSPGAWYLSGLAREAVCDAGGARSAYQRAATLVRPGAGAFLAGRPIDPANGPAGPCSAR